MKKKYIVIPVVFLLAAVIAYFLYWKYPSNRESMKWARSLNAAHVEKIEMIVMPSSEEKRYKQFSDREIPDVVKLVNRSTGKYVEEERSTVGLTRTLYIKLKDGSSHIVSYGRDLVIDGDAYADTPFGSTEDGEQLGDGDSEVPENFYTSE